MRGIPGISAQVPPRPLPPRVATATPRQSQGAKSIDTFAPSSRESGLYHLEERIRRAVEAPPEKYPNLADLYTPERTAERIASFVIRGFSRTSFGREDGESSRRAFVEFIAPYIQRGSDEATALFGDNEEVNEAAAETIRRVRERLDRFAGGTTPAEDPAEPAASSPAASDAGSLDGSAS